MATTATLAADAGMFAVFRDTPGCDVEGKVTGEVNANGEWLLERHPEGEIWKSYVHPNDIIKFFMPSRIPRYIMGDLVRVIDDTTYVDGTIVNILVFGTKVSYYIRPIGKRTNLYFKEEAIIGMTPPPLPSREELGRV